VKKTIVLFTIVGCFLSASPTTADVKLPAVISDNMVLQQKTKAPIWGWARPGEKVSIKPSWQRQKETVAKADEDGKWMAKIDTPKAGGPYTLTVKGDNTITLTNVLVGEVWICSGQSNMQMELKASSPWSKGVFNFETEIATANYPDIRLFTVKQEIADEPKEDCTGSWSKCSPETVAGFSGTAYFFARKLYKELGIPFGLIHTSWGGTPAEAWTSAEFLKRMPYFAEILERMETDDTEQLQKEYHKELNKWWADFESVDLGQKGTMDGWENPDLDDFDWKTMVIPVLWESAGLEGFDGSVWFRKDVQVPESWAGKDATLELGPIDDMDITWVNGKQVGIHNELAWSTPRKYKISASVLKPGTNVIAVQVIDTGGGGGIYGEPGQIKLKTADSSSETISLTGDWKYKVGLNLKDFRAMPLSPNIAKNQNTPTMLYNGMLSPLIPYGIRGAIWYQGESNTGRAYQYRELFPLMIKNWRHDWSQGDFPFYYVQIAPFSYGTEYICPELQEAQFMTLSLPNTGMAVTQDIGNVVDIHPRNKQHVGRRLALWALAKTYGCKDLVYSGPRYKSMKVEGDKIRLFFEHVGGGLMAKGGDLTHFTIAGSDRKFVEAKASIDNNTVVVYSEKVNKPAAVRFAWSNTAVPNFFNMEGLPASSFRTDDWPGVTAPRKK
jgi:sialate O-acetylesterase